MTTDQQSPSHETTGVPTGNTYDKYGTTNPIEARLMRGFFDVLDDLATVESPTRILEVGMGEGHVSARMIEAFPGVPFHGIDLPDPSLTGRWHDIGALGAFADITRLPFPDATFDLVLAIEVLEHVADPDGALAELRRVGTRHLVASVPREPIWRVMNLARAKYVRDLGNTPGHVQHWSARGFERLIARHAEVETRRSPLPWTIVKARFT
jgi:ubiquinone/menaquinone biosynthesis C-methylase UbiE